MRRLRSRDHVAVFVTAVIVFLAVFQITSAMGGEWKSMSIPLSIVADLSTILLMTWYVRKQSRRYY